MRLLQYIGRYMKRRPLALSRIRAYDGEAVAFVYHGKRTDQEETLVMSAEDFILSFIWHIPEKDFKMNRHYDLYSRRIKTLSKKIVIVFQMKVKELLFNVKEMLKTKSWREQIIERFKEDPLKCTHCGNYYEFKGTVAPKNEKTKHTKKLLRNFGLTRNRSKKVLNNKTVNFICSQYGKEELIPTEVVEHFYSLDG